MPEGLAKDERSASLPVARPGTISKIITGYDGLAPGGCRPAAPLLLRAFALDADLQAIVRAAVDQTYIDYWARTTRENSVLLRELKDKHGVNVTRTPPEIHTAVLNAWDRLAERESKDPFFRKVYDSMRSYASNVIPYRKLMWGAVESARDHYWEERHIK